MVMDVLSQILAGQNEHGSESINARAAIAALTDYGKNLRKNESEFKSMSDEALLERLRSFGIKIDRNSLEKLCEKHVSIDEFVSPWIEKAMETSEFHHSDADSIMLVTMALWDRWFPDKPSFARYVGLVEDGFFMMKPEEQVFRAELWKQAYDEMVRLIRKTKIRTLAELDEASEALRCTIHWAESFVILLGKLGKNDDRFHQTRVEVCEELLELLDCEDERFMRFLRKSLAQSCFDFGAEDTATRLYKEWLAEDTGWGKGYVAWAKCYESRNDAIGRQIAEQILREGLGVIKVNDRESILRSLANNLNRQNRTKEAALIFNKLKKSPNAPVECDDESYEGCSCGEPNEDAE
jgi:hypothetical protein